MSEEYSAAAPQRPIAPDSAEFRARAKREWTLFWQTLYADLRAHQARGYAPTPDFWLDVLIIKFGGKADAILSDIGPRARGIGGLFYEQIGAMVVELTQDGAMQLDTLAAATHLADYAGLYSDLQVYARWEDRAMQLRREDIEYKRRHKEWLHDAIERSRAQRQATPQSSN